MYAFWPWELANCAFERCRHDRYGGTMTRDYFCSDAINILLLEYANAFAA